MSATKITVQPVVVSDAPALFSLIERNRQAFLPWFPWVAQTVTLEQEQQFLNYARSQSAAGQMAMFTIRIADTVVGAIDVHNIDSDNHHGELGYWLAANQQGQGIMTEAVEMVVDLAKTKLHLHTLIIFADVKDQKSIAVAQRCGFKLVGVVPDYIYVATSWRNCGMYTRVV